MSLLCCLCVLNVEARHFSYAEKKGNLVSISGVCQRFLHETGNGIYAYLQPDGGWGWSNAGLIVDSGASLLVDTLSMPRARAGFTTSYRNAFPECTRAHISRRTGGRLEKTSETDAHTKVPIM